MVLLAMPVAAAFAAVLASSQDFRSPLILSPYSVSFGERQTDAHPRILGGVEPLKNDEDAIGVARFEADAVIVD